MEFPISKFLVMNRKLPKPFNNVSKNQSRFSSIHAPKDTAATINVPLVKLILSIDKMKQGGVDDGGVGWDSRGFGLAEYPSSKHDIVHVVAYNPSNGFVAAGLFNTTVGSVTEYDYCDGRDSTAILMAMLPHLLLDEEFNRVWYDLQDRTLDPDDPKVIECLAVLSDNIYRRMSNEECPAFIRMNIDSTGKLPMLNRVQLDAGKYSVSKLYSGAFRFFKASKNKTARIAREIRHSGFVGKYANPKRRLSEKENALVPTLSDEYIIPEEIEFVCKHAAYAGKTPMRNFLLRGPAGTGKSAGARAMAAGLNLPYVYMTCSVNTETFDFVGQFIPNEGKTAIDIDSIRQDIMYDTDGAYRKITGKYKEDATIEDCYSALINNYDVDSGGSYRYVETDFIRALKHGYLVEVQEPSCIMQPGVLVGLNALLEQEGVITLPNGERIKRHQDAVVVLTTNTDYEGCRALNQSVIDRMNMVIDMDMPDEQVMKERASRLTGYSDGHYLDIMVRVVRDISEHCRKTGITDGSCGMRSLIDWISSVMITGMPYESALNTVISKATDSVDDRNDIIDTILAQYFTQGQRIA